MTDDEAFVRAILDRPGDDTPRLVYADWLDDHGHPARAAYLRAEAAAVRTGDAAGVQELAAGLDPVWVARVSRPPYGVCCDRVRLTDPGPGLAGPDLAAVERRHAVELPRPYRAFVMNHNGGLFDEVVVQGKSGGCDDEALIRVARLLAVVPAHHPAGGSERAEVLDRRTTHGTTRKYLRFADATSDRAGDSLILGLSGPEAGTVYYHYRSRRRRFDTDDLDILFPDFAALLDALTAADPDLVY